MDEELVGVPRITKDQIAITRFLGNGAFGEVFEGLWYKSNSDSPSVSKVAIKVDVFDLLINFI